ncbi:MAG TPA: PIG-L deacetylase family protein [Longimicrobiales bacterium]
MFRASELKVLAIGAHLDDIELGCGGALARAARAGHCIRMICLSHSAYTDFDGNVLRTREEALREGRAAAETLGCGELEILDFPTKDIPDDSRVVEALDARITEFRPDLIFTHWPFDTHQAHRGAALATIAAARRHNTILMYDPVFPAGRSFVGFRPQVYVDITDAIDGKLEALRRHESQYRKYGDEWIHAVQARARFRGYEMGTEFAEAFEVVRMELEL